MFRISNDRPPATTNQPLVRTGGLRLGALLAAAALWLAACAMPGQSPSGEPQPILMPTPTPVTVIQTEAEAPAEIEPDADDADVDDADSEAAQAAASVSPAYDPAIHTLQLAVFADGFTQPLYVDHAGDGSGRVFVVEKTGSIHIVQQGTVLEPPFLTISDRVRSSGSEQGLLGLAFAPNFAEFGYFFVNYTDAAGDTVVSRFQVDGANPNHADPNSEFLVLQIAQPANNHNGGALKFGPDGLLWIGTGDGGGSGDRFEQAQAPTTLLGKMLRIDVTTDPTVPYLVPQDNPWLNVDWNGHDVRDEIWAVGLRNPWRYSFDRVTGDLWIADVGQNAIEAVHFTPAGHGGGLNYGWPILEGSRCYRQPNACDTTGLELPVLEYAHGQGDCSITGGYIYRGAAFPMLQGAYVYGDYCSGNIWVAVPGPDSAWTDHLALSTRIQISSFGEDENGELYVTGLGDGTVYRIVVN